MPSDARRIVDPAVGHLLARCTFPPPGTPVVCAVSGGADSLALLALAVAAGCSATAVHVDHGLRPDSAAEGDVVAQAAGRLGARFESRRVRVGAGPNLEARARAARRAVLPPGALTGHTADDQAETVLLRLLRGTGPDGVTAMRPDTKPILGLRRRETGDLCRHLGLRVVDDPTNLDPRHLRNRVRHEVLPLLADVAGREVVPLLVRYAELGAEEGALLDGLAAEIDPTDAGAVREVAPVLARRALRRWLREAAGGEERHPPDSAALARVLAVARGEAVAADIGAGWRVRRSGGRLRVEGPGRPPPVSG